MDLFMKVVSKLQKLQASAGISGNHTLKCLIHRTLNFFFIPPRPPQQPVKIMHLVQQLKEADLEWKFLLLVWEGKMIVFIISKDISFAVNSLSY